MIQSLYTSERVFALVKSDPGISAPLVAEKLSMSRVSAYRHLQKLLSLKMVRIQGNGKATRYFPHELITIGINFSENGRKWTTDQVENFKEEVLFLLKKEFDENQSSEGIDEVFDTYCMYIASDDTILTGFLAFLAWCSDPKHDFSDRIIEKALEYLEIVGSMEFRRKKNGFLDGTSSAISNIQEFTKIGFDHFLFLMPSVLENGFGRTRTSIELYYGKLNNRFLLEHTIEASVDPIRKYVALTQVDCLIYTPPTNNRTLQFRDVLEKKLALRLPNISAEKTQPLGKILQPQKEIRDRAQRVRNALISLQVYIPNELLVYKHILILDDSFTTGATPNAIALKLRDA